MYRKTFYEFKKLSNFLSHKENFDDCWLLALVDPFAGNRYFQLVHKIQKRKSNKPTFFLSCTTRASPLLSLRTRPEGVRRHVRRLWRNEEWSINIMRRYIQIHLFIYEKLSGEKGWHPLPLFPHDRDIGILGWLSWLNNRHLWEVFRFN